MLTRRRPQATFAPWRPSTEAEFAPPLVGVSGRIGGCSPPSRQPNRDTPSYIEAHADQVDEHGHRLVVRNGYHEQREVTTAAGAVAVRQPRVNDKHVDETTGQRQRFASSILPAWVRKSP